MKKYQKISESRLDLKINPFLAPSFKILPPTHLTPLALIKTASLTLFTLCTLSPAPVAPHTLFHLLPTYCTLQLSCLIPPSSPHLSWLAPCTSYSILCPLLPYILAPCTIHTFTHSILHTMYPYTICTNCTLHPVPLTQCTPCTLHPAPFMLIPLAPFFLLCKIFLFFD